MSQKSNPLSPHLSIYKPQITSAVSILGRMCGIYTYFFILLSFWFVIFSIYQYTNPVVPLYMAIMAIKISTPLVATFSYIMLFVTAFCLTFYTGTLLRHICWDHNTFLSLKSSSIFGYIIIGVSIILAIIAVLFVAILGF